MILLIIIKKKKKSTSQVASEFCTDPLRKEMWLFFLLDVETTGNTFGLVWVSVRSAGDRRVCGTSSVRSHSVCVRVFAGHGGESQWADEHPEQSHHQTWVWNLAWNVLFNFLRRVLFWRFNRSVFVSDGQLQTDGFSIESCRSMVAVMDVSFQTEPSCSQPPGGAVVPFMWQTNAPQGK